MKYRTLGNTGLQVSEIGLGGEWLEYHNTDEVKAIIDRCADYGMNILDCWMSEPNVRSNIGLAIKDYREKWIIQGHIGSTWQNGQYVRTRDVTLAKSAFEDLLLRLQTDYIDLGMIHFVDEAAEFTRLMSSDFLDYIHDLKNAGTIRHIGLSTHNPVVGQMAAQSGVIEHLLFSLNPAFDMLPASENLEDLFSEKYDDSLSGIAPEREELYRTCERNGIGITVMKTYAGGRLFDAGQSPFGVALRPEQCIHYALTRPSVASVLIGYHAPEHVDAAVAYETATEEQKDYASVLAAAPRHSYSGQCTYCGHCSPCPAHINIATVNKLYDLAVMQMTVPPTVRAHYDSLSAKASDCIACGACEKRCPFHVSIIDSMKKASNLFA